MKNPLPRQVSPESIPRDNWSQSMRRAKRTRSGKRIRVSGLGEFDSGTPDLATNKKHMKDFGRD